MMEIISSNLFVRFLIFMTEIISSIVMISSLQYVDRGKFDNSTIAFSVQNSVFLRIAHGVLLSMLSPLFVETIFEARAVHHNKDSLQGTQAVASLRIIISFAAVSLVFTVANCKPFMPFLYIGMTKSLWVVCCGVLSNVLLRAYPTSTNKLLLPVLMLANATAQTLHVYSFIFPGIGLEVAFLIFIGVAVVAFTIVLAKWLSHIFIRWKFNRETIVDIFLDINDYTCGIHLAVFTLYVIGSLVAYGAFHRPSWRDASGNYLAVLVLLQYVVVIPIATFPDQRSKALLLSHDRDVVDLKAKFVHYVSFALRSPLNVVQVGLDTVKTDMARARSPVTAHVTELFEDLCESAATALLVVDELEDVAEAFKVELTTMDLEGVLKSKADGWTPLAERKNVKLSIVDAANIFQQTGSMCSLMPPRSSSTSRNESEGEIGFFGSEVSPFRININAEKIGQVVRSLVSTALKIAAKGDQITVSSVVVAKGAPDTASRLSVEHRLVISEDKEAVDDAAQADVGSSPSPCPSSPSPSPPRDGASSALAADRALSSALDAILDDPLQSGYLMRFCELEHSTENLGFMVAVSLYKDMIRAVDAVSWQESWSAVDAMLELGPVPLVWPSVRLKENAVFLHAKTIWDNFLSDTCTDQVCLSASIYANTAKRLYRLDLYGPHVFDEALKEPKKTLRRDIFPRFMTSDVHREMVKGLAHLRRLPKPRDLIVSLPSQVAGPHYIPTHSLLGKQVLTLTDSLRNDLLFRQLKLFLRRTHSSENLLCSHLIDIFDREVAHGDEEAMKAQAWIVFLFCVASGSCREVSLESFRKKEIMLSMARPKSDMFTELRKSAFSMLVASYDQYRTSYEYRELPSLIRQVVAFQSGRSQSLSIEVRVLTSESRQRVLNEFVVGENVVTKSSTSSAGLKWGLCRKIVGLHDGQLGVKFGDSNSFSNDMGGEGDGGHSTIFLDLPLVLINARDQKGRRESITRMSPSKMGRTGGGGSSRTQLIIFVTFVVLSAVLIFTALDNVGTQLHGTSFAHALAESTQVKVAYFCLIGIVSPKIATVWRSDCSSSSSDDLVGWEAQAFLLPLCMFGPALVIFQRSAQLPYIFEAMYYFAVAVAINGLHFTFARLAPKAISYKFLILLPISSTLSCAMNVFSSSLSKPPKALTAFTTISSWLVRLVIFLHFVLWIKYLWRNSKRSNVHWRKYVLSITEKYCSMYVGSLVTFSIAKLVLGPQGGVGVSWAPCTVYGLVWNAVLLAVVLLLFTVVPVRLVRQQAMAQIATTREMKGHVVRSTCGDLLVYLNAVQTEIELFEIQVHMGRGGNGTIHSWLSRWLLDVRNFNRQALDIVRNLVLFEDIESGDLKLETAKVSLRRIFADSVPLWVDAASREQKQRSGEVPLRFEDLVNVLGHGGLWQSSQTPSSPDGAQGRGGDVTRSTRQAPPPYRVVAQDDSVAVDIPDSYSNFGLAIDLHHINQAIYNMINEALKLKKAGDCLTLKFSVDFGSTTPESEISSQGRKLVIELRGGDLSDLEVVGAQLFENMVEVANRVAQSGVVPVAQSSARVQDDDASTVSGVAEAKLGLGFFVSRRIFEMHGGLLRVMPRGESSSMIRAELPLITITNPENSRLIDISSESDSVSIKFHKSFSSDSTSTQRRLVESSKAVVDGGHAGIDLDDHGQAMEVVTNGIRRWRFAIADASAVERKVLVHTIRCCLDQGLVGKAEIVQAVEGLGANLIDALQRKTTEREFDYECTLVDLSMEGVETMISSMKEIGYEGKIVGIISDATAAAAATAKFKVAGLHFLLTRPVTFNKFLQVLQLHDSNAVSRWRRRFESTLYELEEEDENDVREPAPVTSSEKAK